MFILKLIQENNISKLEEQKVTIFKLSRNLKDYYVTTGTIIKNLDENNLCRTQILLKIDDNIEYFLNGKKVSESVYRDAIKGQMQKPDAIWYDLTNESLSSTLIQREQVSMTSGANPFFRLALPRSHEKARS